MSKNSREAAKSAKGAVLRMAQAERAAERVESCESGKSCGIRKIRENLLTRAEPYNIIFNCDELFINVWPKPR